jgi:hypothetical protein
MSDPWRIFKADPSRAETLKILWPDLYNCLAELTGGGSGRVVRCALGQHGGRPGSPPAEARLFEGGPPACRDHLLSADRPGGWPLKVERKER